MELLHDDGAIVYLNGQQVAQTPSLSQAGQETYEIPTEAFVVGDNLLAIYVQENAGDQYLDYRLWTDYKKPVASVSLNESEIEIEGGERFTLTATIEPTDAGNKEVRWASADEEIASVTNTGVVFGRKQGTTTIIAYSVENEDIQATCTVTVTSDGPLSPYTDEQGITYRLTDDDTAYMVTSYSSEVEDADLVIPDVLFNIPVTQINSYSFYNDKNLRSLVLSEGIVYVGHNAFHGCSHLKELHIPSTLINLYDGDSPLSSCPNLEVITVAEGNPRYDSREDCNAIIDTESNTMIVGCKGTTFPASVHAIGSDAFYGSSFTEMILPEGITTLGNIAFGGCFQLANITIPSTMTSISNGAFNEGTPLTGTITSYVTEPFPVSCFTDET